MEKLMILVAGPYRSGTGDNPELIAENVRVMTEAALTVYHKGHLPVMGEWLALPLIDAAGSQPIGDERFNKIFHPIANDLIGKWDAVLDWRPFGRSR